LKLGGIQAILPGRKPVADHDKSDAAWFDVTKQLDTVIARVREAARRDFANLKDRLDDLL
jgi:hypothetical protein